MPCADVCLSVCCLQVIHDVHIEPAHIVKKRSIDQPLRILLYYDDSVYRLVCWYAGVLVC